MLTTRLRHDFAPDPALPSRDTLLDPDAVRERLSSTMGRHGLLEVTGCTLVRAKYRIGESLRVVYRLEVGASTHLVTARAFQDGASATALRRTAATLVPSGELRPVVHDPELDSVWWTFPNDRRLRGVDALLEPAPDVAALLGGAARWAASDVVEYAPERSVTLRAVGTGGTASAYIKAFAPGPAILALLAHRYALVARALKPSPRAVSSPTPLWWSDEHHALFLETMPGRPWDQLAGPLEPTLRHLGTAIATLHDTTLAADAASGSSPMAETFWRFQRLDVGRVLHSAELVECARPDVAASTRRLADALSGGPPAHEPPVLLHGDCHPKNALVDGDDVALIDLDQAGIGPAAADIGSFLARLEQARIVDGADTGGLAAAFLDGYADVRPLPAAGSLAWHTSAAMVAERAMRAVNRVHPEALGHLDELLAAAETALCTSVRS